MSLTPRHSEPDGNSGVKNLFFIEILRAKALRMTALKEYNIPAF